MNKKVYLSILLSVIFSAVFLTSCDGCDPEVEVTSSSSSSSSSSSRVTTDRSSSSTLILHISNGYSAYYTSSDFTNYDHLTDLLNYSYSVIHTNTIDLEYLNGVITKSNLNRSLRVTNYYFTNTLTTNTYRVFNSSNSYNVNYGNISGYTKLNTILNYSYYQFSTNDYTLIKDVSNNLGYSNFNQLIEGVSNYYYSNALITNTYRVLNRSNHHNVNYGNISGYRKLRTIVNYSYYQFSSNDYTLIKDVVSNTLGYSNFNQLVEGVNNYYSTNSLTTNGYSVVTNGGRVYVSANSIRHNNIIAYVLNNAVRYLLHPPPSFYGNGKIRDGTLSGNATVDGVSYKSGNRLSFHGNGQVDSGLLNGDQTIGGLPCRGTSPSHSVSFHQNGQLKHGSLKGNRTIDGVNYQPSIIDFYDNGNVKQGRLNGAQTIDGRRCGTFTYIRFNRNGSRHSCGNTRDPDF